MRGGLPEGDQNLEHRAPEPRVPPGRCLLDELIIGSAKAESIALDAVRSYHERTKHDFGRFAASLGFLDWDSQPDPFRRFEGAELIPLAHPDPSNTPSYAAVIAGETGGAASPDFESISAFFYFSLALSAWKGFGTEKWALRVNPSSGNLHPTEGYLVAGPAEGLGPDAGIYHYAPKEHALERRAVLPEPVWKELIGPFPAGSFLVGLSSVHWREAWKYGERAFRYCQHDAGHALAAFSVAAAMQGRRVRALDGLSDDQTARLFGLDRTGEFPAEDAEAPDLAAVVVPAGRAGTVPASVPEGALAALREAAWSGRANALGEGHVPWDAIEAVHRAGCKGSGARLPEPKRNIRLPAPGAANGTGVPCGAVVRNRRSAQALDGKGGIGADAFFGMLSRTFPRADRPPFDAAPWMSFVHLGLFVHRVEGVEPGLYAMARNPGRVDFLKGKMHDKFLWERPERAPKDLPFFLLERGDARGAAAALSCQQPIAGDGAFSLGMLAEFDGPLEEFGAHMYRRLFWETGMIGQVLYLEAEAAGLRGTGIGCFFDDPVHQAFGLRDRSLQSLYHFTVGHPVEDSRLKTIPAYSHLDLKK